MNAKWLFKISGMYQAPLGINVSAFYNARQGYPFERFSPGAVARPRRAASRCSCSIRSATSRLPNYQNVDFHVERPVRVGTVRFVPALDVFNVGNYNTIQAIRGTQNATQRQPGAGAPRAARDAFRYQVQLVVCRLRLRLGSLAQARRIQGGAAGPALFAPAFARALRRARHSSRVLSRAEVGYPPRVIAAAARFAASPMRR